MALDILIEELQGSIWTVALRDGKLEGLEVDPGNEQVRWGSVFWARISRIDSALDAAFLDLDGTNTGILYNKDTRKRDKKTGKLVKGGAQAIGKTWRTGQMIAVQAKSAYLYDPEDKDAPAEKKYPRMSMDVTLSGRHLIYAVTETKNRVSSRITNPKLRDQLMAMMAKLEGMKGFILRSSAAGTQTDMLLRESKILKEAWEQMQKHLHGEKPALIMLGPDSIQRTLSDKATDIIDSIEVVTMEHFNHVEEWSSIFAPDLVPKIQPVELENAEDDLALFHERDVMGQIEDLFQNYALLEHGGNIIIQETAALTAIDVNKGGDRRGALSTNLEAAQEIARQVRLRNIGGIIVIDFINLKTKTEQKKMMAALQEAINDDPCTVQIHGPSALGLVEMTRNRRTPPLQDRFSGLMD